MNSQTAPTAKECFEVYRRVMEHEDGLTNQRTTWLLASQAFLLFPYLAGQHYRLTTQVSLKGSPELEEESLLLWRLGETAIFLIACSCILSLSLAFVAGALAVVKTQTDWLQKRVPKSDRLPEHLYPRTGNQWLGLMPFGLPFVLLAGWIALYAITGDTPETIRASLISAIGVVGIWVACKHGAWLRERRRLEDRIDRLKEGLT